MQHYVRHRLADWKACSCVYCSMSYVLKKCVGDQVLWSCTLFLIAFTSYEIPAISMQLVLVLEQPVLVSVGFRWQGCYPWVQTFQRFEVNFFSWHINVVHKKLLELPTNFIINQNPICSLRLPLDFTCHYFERISMWARNCLWHSEENVSFN